MSVVFANNAATTLAAAITSTSATTITVTSSSSFPSLSGSEYFYATIDDGTNKEIVKVTGVSSETWTVVRAQDGTSARTFANGVDVELRNNAAMLSDIKSFSAFTAPVTGTSGTFDSIVIGSTTITSTAAEINLLDGSTANTVVNSKAVVYGSSGELAGALSTAAQPNVTSLGTLTALTVDNIGIDGSTISNSSGDITLDASGDIILDADGDDIKIAEGGTTVMEIKHESSGIDFLLSTSDEDYKFKGSDGGSTITALQLDMSEAGHATFNGKVTVGTNAVGTLTTDNDGSFDMAASNNFKCTPSGNFTLTFTNIVSQSGNILLVNSGGHTVSAHTNSKVDANLLATVSTAGTYLISYFSDGTNVYLTNSAAYT